MVPRRSISHEQKGQTPGQQPGAPGRKFPLPGWARVIIAVGAAHHVGAAHSMCGGRSPSFLCCGCSPPSGCGCSSMGPCIYALGAGGGSSRWCVAPCPPPSRPPCVQPLSPTPTPALDPPKNVQDCYIPYAGSTHFRKKSPAAQPEGPCPPPDLPQPTPLRFAQQRSQTNRPGFARPVCS